MTRTFFPLFIYSVLFLTVTMAVTPVTVPKIDGTWKFSVVITSASDNKPNFDSWTQRLILKQYKEVLKVYSLTQTITPDQYPMFQGFIKKDTVVIEKIECDGACIERYTLKLEKNLKSMKGYYYYKEAEGEPEVVNTGTVKAEKVH